MNRRRIGTKADLMVEQAAARAKAARSQVLDTVGLIRRRLDPRTLAYEAVRSVGHGAAEALEATSTVARSRPVVVAILATGIGLAATFGRRFIAVRKDETNLGDDRSTPQQEDMS